ncbi:muts protein 4-like protein [Vairimorpha necatrix]|uniref:Muts protein 4-like protein n=1 Tax=Vairimorpha necatrix TaxID=6039 RepID=A0AAX4JFD0_9MICR
MQNYKTIGCITCNREIPIKLCFSFTSGENEIGYITFYDAISFLNLNQLIKKYSVDLLLVQKEHYLIIEGCTDVNIQLLERSGFKENKNLNQDYFSSCSIGALMYFLNKQNVTIKQKYLDNRSFVIDESQDKLYDVINFTSTCYGRRKLKLDLMQPLVEKNEIVSRHEKILFFRNNKVLALNIEKLLKSLPDIERFINSDCNNNEDLKGYKKIIYHTTRIYNFLSSYKHLQNASDFFKSDTKYLIEKFENIFIKEVYDQTQVHLLFNSENNDYLKLAKKIYQETLESIDDYLTFLDVNFDYKIMKNSDNEFFIKVKIDPSIDLPTNELAKFPSQFADEMKSFCFLSENEETTIKDLSVKSTSNFDSTAHIKNTSKVHQTCSSNLPPDFIILTYKDNFLIGSTLELQKLNYRLKEVYDQILEIGGNLCNDLIIECKTKRKYFNDLFEEISEIDLCLSGYKFSLKFDCCIPNIGDRLCVSSSYHIFLKKDRVIYNDIYISEITRLNVLTGSNMSGKSAYTKQIFYNSLLYQIGYPIPAKNGIIKIFRKIVYKSNKTSSPEELFNFIDKLNLNEDSLIIIDEIGKGIHFSNVLPTYLTISRFILISRCYSVIITHHISFIQYIYNQAGFNTIKSVEYKISHGFYNTRLSDIREITGNLNISLSCDLPDEENTNIKNVSKLAFDIKQCRSKEDEEKIVRDIKSKHLRRY